MRFVKLFVMPAVAASLFYSMAIAEIPRSRSAVAEFKQLHPCPANGKKRGPCPGWQVDHVVPLKCKGADHFENMQWLTVEEHKEKTRREFWLCR